jgi:hypothetical protein
MQLDPLQPPRRSINLAKPDFLNSVGTAVGGRSQVLRVGCGHRFLRRKFVRSG